MKFKKSILAIGSIAAVAAPVASVVACSSEEVKPGGIFTEYVRSHDMLLSLGVSPQYHARSDLGTTHGLTNEGYLVPFTNGTTKNGKCVGNADAEYFTSLQLGAFFSRTISDPKGAFDHVDHKFDVENSNAIKNGNIVDLNWKTELAKVGKDLDSVTGGNEYETKASKVLAAWAPRETKLINDAKANTSDKKVLIVNGTDDDTTIFDAIIPTARVSELYGLDNITMPVPTNSTTIDTTSTWAIKAKDTSTSNTELLNAYAKSADVVIYLKTPMSNVTDEAATNAIKGFARPNGKVLIRSYDGWLLPFNGAAIGANVVMDNIEKDILGNSLDSSWKSQFAPSKLKSIYLTPRT